MSRQSVDKEFPENRDFSIFLIVSSLIMEKCKNGFVRILEREAGGVNCHTLKFEDHSKNNVLLVVATFASYLKVEK